MTAELQASISRLENLSKRALALFDEQDSSARKRTWARRSLAACHAQVQTLAHWSTPSSITTSTWTASSPSPSVWMP